MHRLTRAVALATVLLLVGTQVAFGARPSHDKFTVEESFEETLCGVDVATTVIVHGNGLDFGTHFVDLSQVFITWTDADGNWISNIVAGPATFSEQLDGDILTIVERHRGVHERLRSSDGLLPAFDRGQIGFVTVIDLNDPEDDEDDEVLVAETTFQAGPHPDADADFTLVCDAFESVFE